MTIKELEQYRKLQNEVNQLAQRLEKMSKGTGGIVSDFVKGSSHDLRAKETVFTITGLDQRNRLKYERLQGILQRRTNRLCNDLLKIEIFIDGVECSKIRQIITHRYIEGRPWEYIAEHVYGEKDVVEDTPRKAIINFFKNL